MSKAWEATVRRSQLGFRRRGMSVAHVDDDDEGDSSTPSSTTSSEIYHHERKLSNGDFYQGQWLEGLPHGQGKYVWEDGCMYVGEWIRGKTMGNGRFSWPSGATYEGEFKSGFMDGKGTYTGSGGDTYRGSWYMNDKQGNGIKYFWNGDLYDGEWRRDQQDGHGKYQWGKSGNQYIGQWKNGKINGNGTLIWRNGNRYDGNWEDGLPKGQGKFHWTDGSVYVGVWNKDPREQNGIHYPGNSPNTNLNWDPQDVFTVYLNECTICPSEKVPVLPSQKAINWTGIGVHVDSSTGDYVCNWESGNCQNVDVNENGFLSRGIRKQPTMKIKRKDMTRQGETISRGHKNYELMLNLQLGIRHAVGRPTKDNPDTILRSSAFNPKEKVWTRFPPEGSKSTPPHSSTDFKWKDYNPVVFRYLRKLFQEDAADYMISLCGDEALRELSSPGKSGSFFYLTNDDRYMIKTIKKSEAKVLLRMLPAYYHHVKDFENTLVTKLFGLHSVKLTGATQKKVHFVIMGNLFCSEYFIHRRFDLKGSSQGRTTDKSEAEINQLTILKDLDLNFIFRLEKARLQELQRQIDKDCEFLEMERIMDYSLLVGIHFRETSSSRDLSLNDAPRTSAVRTPRGNDDLESELIVPRISRADRNDLPFDPPRYHKLGIDEPARVEQTIRKSDFEMVGEPTGEFYDVILFFGIIDILQNYDIKKIAEHAIKSKIHDPASISAVDPKQYSRRFRDFIFKAFAEDNENYSPS